MSDLSIAVCWIVVLSIGFASALALHALGVASTYVRDMLHVGAGVWVLGWVWWRGDALPIAIVAGVAFAIAILPFFVDRLVFARRLYRAVTGDDERWGGLVLYTFAYAIFTIAGVSGEPFAAGAALLALSLGDGIGGAVGRAFGTHHFRAPGGKRKSFEGSAVVALGAFAGVLISAALFDVSIGIGAAAGLGLVAALTEALSPRGTDNLAVPLAVFIAVHFVT
jgi:dolichol kinase